MDSYSDHSLEKCAEELASDKPTPGGGSSAGVSGVLAASLLMMVIGVSENSSELNDLAEELEYGQKRALELIDEDAESFEEVMEAFRLPQESAEESRKRSRKIQEAFRSAASTPLEMLELAADIAEIAVEVARKGNDSAITDAAAGVSAADSAAEAAYFNVMINLDSIEDEEFVEQKAERARKLREKAAEKKSEVIDQARNNIQTMEGID